MDPPKKKPINPHLAMIGEYKKYFEEEIENIESEIDYLKIEDKIYNITNKIILPEKNNEELSLEALEALLKNSTKDAQKAADPEQVKRLKAQIKALQDRLAAEQNHGFIKAHERAQSDAEYYSQKASQLESRQAKLLAEAAEAKKKADSLKAELAALEALKKDRELLQERLKEAEDRVQHLEDERAHRDREGAAKFGNNRPRALE